MIRPKLPLKLISYAQTERISTVDSTGLGWDDSALENLVQVLLLILFFVLFGVFVFNLDYSIAKIMHLRHHNILIFLFCSGVVFLGAGYNISRANIRRNNELKIIECSENGIRLGSGKFDLDRSFFVSWNVVSAVEAVACSDSKQHYLVLSTHQKKIYEVKWGNAFSWVDEESFFSIVKGNASHASINWDIEEVAGKDKLDTRYTNLWLHYFSAPTNRQRKGALEIGEILQEGDYEILEHLGGGGQGMAYVARCNRNDAEYRGTEKVVLKEYILPVYRGNSLESKKYERLSREAEILAQLDHEQIVKIYDCFIEDHRGYLVLEHISGKSLNEIVKENGPYDQIDVAKIGMSVLNILSYLHGQEKPVLHRDVTPDNLMFTEQGVIKLLDFTVAQESSSNHRTATVVGKQSYMPPEQFRGNPTAQSDIYSLGCTMFYLLTGQDPKPMELESAVPYVGVENLDPELDQIIQKAAAFKLSDRFTNAAEMADALNSWLKRGQGSFNSLQ